MSSTQASVPRAAKVRKPSVPKPGSKPGDLLVNQGGLRAWGAATEDTQANAFDLWSNGLRTIRRAVVTPLKRKSQATPAISRSDSKPAVPPAARGRPIAAVARELVPVRVQRIAHECRHGNYCAHCGGGIPLGSRATYCGRCGTGLPKLSRTKAPSCGHCEHVLPRIDDATYCPFCAEPLDGAANSCRSCHVTLPSGDGTDKFCSDCGAVQACSSCAHPLSSSDVDMCPSCSAEIPAAAPLQFGPKVSLDGCAHCGHSLPTDPAADACGGCLVPIPPQIIALRIKHDHGKVPITDENRSANPTSGTHFCCMCGAAAPPGSDSHFCLQCGVPHPEVSSLGQLLSAPDASGSKQLVPVVSADSESKTPTVNCSKCSSTLTPDMLYCYHCATPTTKQQQKLKAARTHACVSCGEALPERSSDQPNGGGGGGGAADDEEARDPAAHQSCGRCGTEQPNPEDLIDVCGRCCSRLPDDLDAENCDHCGADLISAARSAGLCGGCGVQLPPRKPGDSKEDDAFCGSCGTPVGDEWLKLRMLAGKCHKCNHALSDDPSVAFCGVCGTKRIDADTAATRIQKVFRGAKARKSLGLMLRRAGSLKNTAGAVLAAAAAAAVEQAKPEITVARATTVPIKPAQKCKGCNATTMDPDAKFCSQCGDSFDGAPRKAAAQPIAADANAAATQIQKVFRGSKVRKVTNAQLPSRQVKSQGKPAAAGKGKAAAKKAKAKQAANDAETVKLVAAALNSSSPVAEDEDDHADGDDNAHAGLLSKQTQQSDAPDPDSKGPTVTNIDNRSSSVVIQVANTSNRNDVLDVPAVRAKPQAKYAEVSGRTFCISLAWFWATYGAVQLSLLQSWWLAIAVAVCMVLLARFLTINLCDCCYPSKYENTKWWKTLNNVSLICAVIGAVAGLSAGYFLADHFIAAAHNMNMVPGAAPASSMGATGLAIGLVLLALLFVLTAFLAYRIAGKGPDHDEEALLNSDSADASVMA